MKKHSTSGRTQNINIASYACYNTPYSSRTKPEINSDLKLASNILSYWVLVNTIKGRTQEKKHILPTNTSKINPDVGCTI